MVEIVFSQRMEEFPMQPALGSREEKRAFYKMTFRITLPIALQNLMDACVNSADEIGRAHV